MHTANIAASAPPPMDGRSDGDDGSPPSRRRRIRRTRNCSGGVAAPPPQLIPLLLLLSAAPICESLLGAYYGWPRSIAAHLRSERWGPAATTTTTTTGVVAPRPGGRRRRRRPSPLAAAARRSGSDEGEASSPGVVRRYLATCVPGLEPALSRELTALGASDVEASGSAAVTFASSPDDGFDVGLSSILWLRTAHRVMELVCSTSFRRATDRDDLYDFVRSKADVPSLLFGPDGRMLTLSVSTISNGHLPRDLCHTHYTALTVKNALVDDVRDRSGGRRPSVDLVDPDVPLVVTLRGHGGAEADVALYRCLHAGSLHRRGYRLNDSAPSDSDADGEHSGGDSEDGDWEGRRRNRRGRRGRGDGGGIGGGGDGEAPIHAAALKESLAAGLLLTAGWDLLCGASRSDGEPAVLLDPTCGSATFCVEAALIAGDVAPGLVRVETCRRETSPHRDPPAVRWGDHSPEEWRDLLAEAAGRAREGLAWAGEPSPRRQDATNVVIRGNDIHPRSADLARSNVAGAGLGLERLISVRCGDCADWDLGSGGGGGRVVVPGRTIVVSNPPWGLRLEGEVESSWVALRDFLRRECDGAEAWVLSGDAGLTRHLRMRKTRGVPIRTAGESLRWIQYHVFKKGEAQRKMEELRAREEVDQKGRRGAAAKTRADREEVDNAWY